MSSSNENEMTDEQLEAFLSDLDLIADEKSDIESPSYQKILSQLDISTPAESGVQKRGIQSKKRFFSSKWISARPPFFLFLCLGLICMGTGLLWQGRGLLSLQKQTIAVLKEIREELTMHSAFQENEPTLSDLLIPPIPEDEIIEPLARVSHQPFGHFGHLFHPLPSEHPSEGLI